MNNEQYVVFENAFLQPGRELLEKLREALIQMGRGPFTEIEQTDHDTERGLEFRKVDDPTVFVELRLTDGDSSGFEGVGLIMDCSTYLCGQIWAPGNFTEDVGMTDAADIPVRLATCPVGDVAMMVEAEWMRIESAASSQRMVG